MSGPRSETGQGLLVESCSSSSFGKDELNEVHNALVANGIKLHHPSLFRQVGAKQLRLELTADVSVDRERLSHIDITIDDEGQVGEVNGLAALESAPLVAAHFEVLLFPLSSGVGEQVASDVTPVDASRRLVAELDYFITASLLLSWSLKILDLRITDTSHLRLRATTHFPLVIKKYQVKNCS